MNYYLSVLKNYAVFSGRARRAEYWYFILFNLIITIILMGIDYSLGLQIGISTVYSLAVLIPSIAVSVRRLHDTGRTGWWLLLPIVAAITLVVPAIGAFVVLIADIVIIVFLVLAGTRGENKYGADPIPATA